jgi:holin-like protein
MLYGFLILIGCKLVGEILVGVTGAPIPPPVVGMFLLFVGLIVKGGVPESLDIAGNGLLKYIGLLFVPAGAGISMYMGLIAAQWDMILVASVSATVLTLLVCGWLFQLFAKGEE